MSKKINISQVDEIVKSTKTNQQAASIIFGDAANSQVLEIQEKQLSLSEISDIVDKVAEYVFVGGQDYAPEYFETVVFALYLQYATNINIPKVKIGGKDVIDLNKIYEWKSNASVISQQYSRLVMYADSKVKFKKELISRKSKFDEFFSAVSSLQELNKSIESESASSNVVNLVNE